MPTLNIEGQKVRVGEEFLKLSPEQQADTVDEIAASLGIKAGGGNGGAPDPKMAEFTGEVLSGDAKRSRAAQKQNEYEQMPAWKQAGVAVDDLVRLGADGLTAGYGDKIGGKISEYTGIGPSEEERRQNTEDARSRAGWAGTAAELAGSVVGAGKVLKGGAALVRGASAVSPTVGRVASAASNLAARPGIVGVGARTTGAAATGAGIGALDAAGHDRDIGEGALYGAAFGAGGNLLGEAAAKTAGKVAGAFNTKPVIMSLDELKAASRSAYDAADNAGLVLNPSAMQRLTAKVQADLASKGYHPKISPEIGATLDELGSLSQKAVTLQGVDVLRQIADGAAGAPNAKTQMLGKAIKGHIDGFLDNLNHSDVLMGNAREGIKALKEARRLWASVKKTQMIQEAIERAKNNAGSSYSGGNGDNALRQQFRAILNNPKKAAGLTRDEKALMTLIVRGVKGEILLRTAAKLSPTGSGLMTVLQAGGIGLIGPAALAAPAIGVPAKMIADRLTPGRVDRLSELIRAGGSASATQAAPNAVQRLAQAKRQALTMPLTSGGIVLNQGAAAEDPE